MTAPWVFTQVTAQQKTLKLDGWDAPHGRPRMKPIVEDGVESRHKRTYYSGNDEPTRHIFGTKLKDLELSGRFMDRYGGPGYARTKAEYAKAFADDKIPVLITWGQNVAVTGYIAEFTPKRESEAEIAWEMKVEVDVDHLLQSSKIRGDAQAPAPEAFVDVMSLLMVQALVPVEDQPDAFKGSFFDSLDSIVVGLTSAFATLANVALAMSSFEDSLVGDLRRFRAGLGQFKTALIIFRDTYQDFRSETALEGDNAAEQLSFARLQSASAVASMQLMFQIAEADRQAQIAERGKILGFYEAKEGDTWEGISRQVYGSITRSTDLREANGIAPGVDPVAGTTYAIPR